MYTRALPFYSLQKECFLSGIARITSPPQPPHPHTPHPPTFFKRENSHSYIFHGSPFNGRGKAHKKGRISKNVGWWEGDINIQPKKQFRVQSICISEEIDQRYSWWKCAKNSGRGNSPSPNTQKIQFVKMCQKIWARPFLHTSFGHQRLCEVTSPTPSSQ